MTGKFSLLSSIIQVSFPNCDQFDLPASLQIILEEKKKKKSQMKADNLSQILYTIIYMQNHFCDIHSP